MNEDKKPLVIVKIGSGSIASPNENGVIGVNKDLLAELASGIDQLQKNNYNVIVVTSGAVAAGMAVKELSVRPTDPSELGYLASVGQPVLMDIYSELFGKYGTLIAQVMPERASYHDKTRRDRMFEIRKLQLEANILVFINENDPVVGDELTFGDNDFVAALESIGMDADYLVLLTDQDGILSGDPKANVDVDLIEYIDDVTPELFTKIGAGSGSLLGSGGGSLTKIYAADLVRHNGVQPIIANVTNSNNLIGLVEGDIKATRFFVKNSKQYDVDFACEILDRIAQSYQNASEFFDVAKYCDDIDNIAKNIGISNS